MKKAAGFTLVEIMIVMVLIGVLAAIALPSYQQSVVNSRRADAMAVLQGLSQAMERYYTETGTYTGASTALYSSKSPFEGAAVYYNLTISELNSGDYILLATPANGQVGDGILTLTNTGLRGWDRDNNGSVSATTEQCCEAGC